MAREQTFGSWWPFTFAGVARFAWRPLRALLLLQLLVALLGGAAVATYVALAWASLVPDCIAKLPNGAAFSEGRLVWLGASSPIVLAQNGLAAVVIDPEHSSAAGQLSDLQVEFGASSWRLRSILGYTQFKYLGGYVPLNSPDVTAQWGAWKPALVFGSGLIAALLIWASWVLLALLYAPAALLLGYFADKGLNFGAAMKLCGAALMPGGIFFSVAIVLYAFGRLNLLGLGLAATIHLLIGMVYVLCAPFRVPKKQGAFAANQESDPSNPFAPPANAPKSAAKNPFATKR